VVLVLGAIAIAQTLLTPEEPEENAANEPAAKPSSADVGQKMPRTIPDAEKSVAESSPPADLEAGLGTVSPASYETELPASGQSSLQLTMPSPDKTVRANDESESTVPTSAPPDPAALAADLNRNAPYDPSSAPAPVVNPPADYNPLPPNTQSVTDDAESPSAPASPANEHPVGLNPSLSAAARDAIGDSTAATGGYYDGGQNSSPPATSTISAPDINPPVRGQDRSEFGLAPNPGTYRIGDGTGGAATTIAAPQASFGSPATLASGNLDGDGTPGADALEGLQSPALTLEKSAPAEIQVGKEATFQLRVRNVGSVAAHDVVVLDRVPRGTRFVNATPASNRAPDGQLMWQLSTLQPGDEAVVSLQLLPLAEGEIGSVAQVLFQSHASVRTICTKPELTVSHTGPQRVLIGETVTFDITISNPGTGEATGVVLEENVPEGLAHIAGNELINEMGALKPGETRRLQITLKADKPGIIENVLLVRGDGNLIAKDSIRMEVIAPTLQVSLNGPSVRFLEREAIYDVAVANTGTATAREVELVTYLPKGMKYVSADHKGQYEPQNHAVYWSLEELPPNQTGLAKLTLMPVETGEQKLNLEGRAELGLQHKNEKTVQVDSLAELQFTIADAADPIEVGTDTTYMITLTNSGSSAATNIQLAIGLPRDLRPIGGEGPTRVVINGTQVMVDPLARLAPGEETVYRLKVHGLAAGPQRIQVQLQTDETPVPVTKEEITRVYSDGSGDAD